MPAPPTRPNPSPQSQPQAPEPAALPDDSDEGETHKRRVPQRGRGEGEEALEEVDVDLGEVAPVRSSAPTLQKPKGDPWSASGAPSAGGPSSMRDTVASSGGSQSVLPGARRDPPLSTAGGSQSVLPGARRDPPLSMAGGSPSMLPGATDEREPGSIVAGRYLLERAIGRGGMGMVWVGRDLTLDIDVAIKLIRHDRAAPEARGRLLQEARAAARIGHPSIVRVFDFGESIEGDPFIVMELLHGESLSGVLQRRQRLAPLVAVSTLLPVASALVAAHSKGIVHRDLKPDNLLLVSTEAGALVPKLLDFGIARLLDADPERRFTLAGEVLGSPDYMSPEQARGEIDVGAATDIWAFSVLLYEAITGKRPFNGINYNALILAIITATPTPTTELAAGDGELWSILARGLEKDATARWPSMRELGVALAFWASERGLREDVAGSSLSSHWLAGTRRHVPSVYPPDSRRAAATASSPPSGPLTSPAIIASLPPAAAAPYLAEEVMTLPPFVPRRRPWLVLGVTLALAAATAAVYSTCAADPAVAPLPGASAAPSSPPPAPKDISF